METYYRYLGDPEWRKAIHLCQSVLSDRATFAEEETEYKPKIAKRVRVTLEAVEKVLRQHSLRDREGHIVGTTFTADMNKLFERFVEQVVRDEARRYRWQLKPQALRYLDTKREIAMYPDLVLLTGGRDFAMGDVKYKDLGMQAPSNEDVYQLLAYCVSMNLPAGLLIYASARPLERRKVQHAGVSLEMIGIDMSGRPHDVEAQVRSAAGRLLQQADNLRSRHGATISLEAG